MNRHGHPPEHAVSLYYIEDFFVNKKLKLIVKDNAADGNLDK